MRWTLGEEIVQRLLDTGELQRVPLAQDTADAMLAAARSHVESAARIRDHDLEGAYVLCYDAARKACASLLQVQGLRVTSRGGHIALKEVMAAQFANTSEGRALRRLDQMRRRRNVLEYGGPPGETITKEELDEAISWASEIVDFCARLLPGLHLF